MKLKEIKKLVVLPLSLLLLVGCNETTTGGDEGDSTPVEPVHVHTYATEWSKDATNHWHAATCGHDVKSGEEAHTFGAWSVVQDSTEEAVGSKKRTCSVCGYEETGEIAKKEHEHKYAETWSSDETNHWHAATCGHDVKSGEEAHTFGAWAETTAPTADADGVETRSCTVCSKEQTRAVPNRNIGINYDFDGAKGTCYTVTDDAARGINITSPGDSNGYEGFYIDMRSYKVENLSKYTFKIKNNGDSRIELRFGYRNTSVNPRTFANDSDVNNYTISSLNNRSNTKKREVKDGFFRCNIESKDIADIAIPMVTSLYDQFVLIAVHTSAIDFTIIETGYVAGNHSYEESWSSDDTYHWHACTEEGCSFVSSKGEHEWVADTTKTDVPATTEAEGVEYKVCSVCGKTKEKVIEKLDDTPDADFSLMNNGFVAVSSYTVTKGEEKYEVSYTQAAGKYVRMDVAGVANLIVTKANYVVWKVKNTLERDIAFASRVYDNNGVLAIKDAEVLSSANGNSVYTRTGSTCSYFTLAAGDTAEFKINLKDEVTGFNEISFMLDYNPSEDTSGTMEVLGMCINGKVEAAPAPSTIDIYGTWTDFSKKWTCTKQEDKSTKVEYAQTSATYTSNQMNCDDIKSLIASYTGIKTITVEITNNNATEFHSCLAVKDDSAIISNASTQDDCTGGVTFNRHSSGSGEYFNVAAGQSGTITAHIADGKVPTKLRLLVDYDQEITGSIVIGKITLGF